jgi:hypothetical protein
MDKYIIDGELSDNVLGIVEVDHISGGCFILFNGCIELCKLSIINIPNPSQLVKKCIESYNDEYNTSKYDHSKNYLDNVKSSCLVQTHTYYDVFKIYYDEHNITKLGDSYFIVFTKLGG